MTARRTTGVQMECSANSLVTALQLGADFYVVLQMTNPHSSPPVLMRRTQSSALLSVLAAVFATASANPLQAQQAEQPLTGAVSAGLSLNVTAPRGAFAETTNNGFGLSANVLFRLEPNSILNFRADVAFQNYGNVRQRVPLSPTLGNLIRVDLNTSNNIATFLVGPQLLGPTGAFTPYASALGGFSAFWTSSSVEGTDNQRPFANTTNSTDFAWAYGGATGAYIRVRNGARPIQLDLGVRYLRHDDVTYLTADEVRQSFEDQRNPQPLRSRVDYFTYYAGVQAIVF